MLKRQNCYLLKKVNDTYWLLPYGQAVADQKKGCQLNETGVFIWQALEHPMSEDQLIQKLAEHYGIEDADRISLSTEEKGCCDTCCHFFTSNQKLINLFLR